MITENQARDGANQILSAMAKRTKEEFLKAIRELCSNRDIMQASPEEFAALAPKLRRAIITVYASVDETPNGDATDADRLAAAMRDISEYRATIDRMSSKIDDLEEGAELDSTRITVLEAVAADRAKKIAEMEIEIAALRGK